MSDQSPVLVVLAEGIRRVSQSLRIPEGVQLNEGLTERVGELWRQAQLDSESPMQALVVGLR